MNLHQAVEDWRSLIGADNVRTDGPHCVAWGRRTFAPDAAVGAVIAPGTVEAVAACLAVATRHTVPVHPVSRGANWGLGSKAPTIDGAVILDLRRLDRITDFDPDRGLVRIEAGVTFQALAAFLAARTRDFFLPTIGGPIDASALANALERGDGSMGERWSSLCEFEIVLPNGQILHTGCSPIGGGNAVGLMPGPVGPLVEGLFSQSNFGVVTSAVVRLETMPSDLAVLDIDVGGLDELAAFLPVWRACQMEQSLAERSLSLWNGIKILALDHVRAALPPERIAGARTGEWQASALVRAESAEILEQRLDRLAGRFRTVSHAVEAVVLRRNGVWEEGCENYLGIPEAGNLKTVYWYKDSQPALDDIDLDRDDCGLIWLCLVFPFEIGPLSEYLVWARGRLETTGIDLNVGIESNGFRCLLSYFTIGYDRRRPGADAAALLAYRALLDEGMRRGFAPYRLANGVPLPAALTGHPLAGYLTRLRSVGDPAGILSPGRVGLGGTGCQESSISFIATAV